MDKELPLQDPQHRVSQKQQLHGLRSQEDDSSRNHPLPKDPTAPEERRNMD